MKAATVRRPTPAELKQIERHEAWLEYLEAVRLAPSGRYEQVEVWAWARLQAKLRRLRERKVAA